MESTFTCAMFEFITWYIWQRFDYATKNFYAINKKKFFLNFDEIFYLNPNLLENDNDFIFKLLPAQIKKKNFFLFHNVVIFRLMVDFPSVTWKKNLIDYKIYYSMKFYSDRFYRKEMF